MVDGYAVFPMLRHVALFFFLLGWGYGLLIRRTEGVRFPASLFMLLAFLALEHGFVFFWLLLFSGPANLAQGLPGLFSLLTTWTVLMFWAIRPTESDLRRFWFGHVVALLVTGGLVLAFGVFRLSVPGMLRVLYGLSLLGVVALLAWMLRSHRFPGTGRVFPALSLFLVALAAGLEAWGRIPQGLLFGLVELTITPMLWAWPFVWYPTVRLRRAPQTVVPARPDERILEPYLEQLEALLEVEQGRAWNPVPFIVQTVLLWMAQRLGLHREPRGHVPLPHLLERLFERRGPDLARYGLQCFFRVDPALSVDPGLGEWLMELALAYLLRYADPNHPVEWRLQGGAVGANGPALYVKLRHALRPAAASEASAAWIEPAVMLGRLVLLDMGGDWWVEDDAAANMRTIWMHIPLQGFGRLLHPERRKTPRASA